MYYLLGGGTPALHMSASQPAPPPFPISLFVKFKRFGAQKKLLWLFLFSVADFFSWTKTFIDIDYIFV
jgi:hypothetical protein